MGFKFRQTISKTLFILLFLSKTFSLDVNDLYEPQDKNILEGKKAEFLCIFSEWKQGLRCVWKHNNSTIQHQISKYKVHFIQHYAKCQLEISEVTLSDSGKYSCHMVNRTDVILKSSRHATLTVVPFPTPICQSNQESYMVGDILVLYCIAEITDEVSTDPSKLEWGSFDNVSTRIIPINNGTHIISQNELVVREELNRWTFVCRLNVDNLDLNNKEKKICKKAIHVNINVTIFTSDNLQVGQSAAFQCKTGHACPQCEYNWTINNTNLLVNISEPKLNLTITDEIIDNILVCNVIYPNQVHGYGTYVISGSTLGTTINSTVSNESYSQCEICIKKNAETSTKNVLIVSLIIYLLIIIFSSYGICIYKRSKQRSYRLLYNRNLKAYSTRLTALPTTNTSEQHSHHNSDASIATYAVIPDNNSATAEPERQKFTSTSNEHSRSVNVALTTFSPCLNSSTLRATGHTRPMKAQSLVNLSEVNSTGMDHTEVNSKDTTPFYFTLTAKQLSSASANLNKPKAETSEADSRFYFTLNQEPSVTNLSENSRPIYSHK